MDVFQQVGSAGRAVGSPQFFTVTRCVDNHEGRVGAARNPRDVVTQNLLINITDEIKRGQDTTTL